MKVLDQGMFSLNCDLIKTNLEDIDRLRDFITEKESKVLELLKENSAWITELEEYAKSPQDETSFSEEPK